MKMVVGLGVGWFLVFLLKGIGRLSLVKRFCVVVRLYMEMVEVFFRDNGFGMS